MANIDWDKMHTPFLSTEELTRRYAADVAEGHAWIQKHLGVRMICHMYTDGRIFRLGWITNRAYSKIVDMKEIGNAR